MNVFELFATLSLDSSGYEEGLEKSEEQGSKFGTGLKKAGKVVGGALVAASAATVKFGKDSVEAGMAFDTSMSQVAATMGLTTDEIGDLREYAQKMGSETVFSATQSADALNYMALAGYDAETSMEMLPNVLNLAAAGGIELASASDMVTDAQSALGLSLEETTTMVDQMAKASSKSNTSVAQLGEAFLTVGGTAKNLQGGTNELSTALGILADNGIKGAEGGTTLRNMILSLTAPTDTAATKLEEMGISAFDAEGNMRPLNDVFSDLNGALSLMGGKERAEALSDIFNKVDLKGVNAMLANTTNRMDELNLALENSGINWDAYKDKIFGVGEDFDQGSYEDFFTQIIADVSSFQDGLTEEQRKQYEDWFNYMLGDEADAQALLQALETTIGSQEARWEELSAAIDDSSGAAQKMADTQLDNLAGDITLFKSALEGAQIAISDSLSPSLRDFVQLGSKGLSDVTKGFQEGGLKGAMESFGTWLSELVGKIFEALPTILEAGAALLGTLVSGIISNLPLLLDTALSLIDTLANGLNEYLPVLIPAVVDVILTITEKLTEPDTISLLINAAFLIIGGIATGIIRAIPSIVKTIPQLVKNLIGSIQQNFPQIVTTLLSLLGDLFLTIMELISEAMGLNWETVKKGWQVIADGIKTAFENVKITVDALKEVLGEKVSAIFTSIKDKVTKGFEPITTKISAVLEKIVGFFREHFGGALEVVTNTINSIKSAFDFEWHLPELKLPHISVKGGEAPYGIGGKGSLPSFDIQWYKKAYNDAYLLNDATIFGMQGGSLLGGGEGNGSEAIVGTGFLKNMMRDVLREQGYGSSPNVIQVYIGEDKIDEFVVNSQQRANFLSGGR